MSGFLSKLIEAIGEENVGFQFVDQSLIKAEWDHKKGSKITFGTDVPVGPSQVDKFGIVLWVDRDRLEEARKLLGVDRQL